jgi:hypothetical protein
LNAYRVVFEDYDPRPVLKKLRESRRRFGPGVVAVVDRAGRRMCVRKTGGGRSTMYEVAVSCEIGGDGRAVPERLVVIEEARGLAGDAPRTP